VSEPYWARRFGMPFFGVEIEKENAVDGAGMAT
jgi:hypothetical protein